MRAIALSLALCLAVPELAQAITFENPTRSALARLTVCDTPPPGPCNVIGGVLESADLGKMEGTATIPIAGNASAYQTSLLVGSHAEGSGGIRLVQSLAEAHSDATSQAAFEFALDGPALVRISLASAYSQNPLARVSVLWAAGGLFELLPEGERTIFGGGVDSSNGPASDSRSLQFEQVLPVGRYWFGVTAYGSMFWHPDSLSTSDWAFTLDVVPVPEPAGLALAALALTRRFGGAGRRSRSV